MSIYFRFLLTDWLTIRQPRLKGLPLVISTVSRGRMVVRTVNEVGIQKGITTGMAIADARARIPGVEIHEAKPDMEHILLRGIARWCIAYTPVAAVDELDGIMLDISGCAHLWGGETPYLIKILSTLYQLGYKVNGAIADTIAAAWAAARFGHERAMIIPPGKQEQTLSSFPVEGLKMDETIITRLRKLKLNRIGMLFSMPRGSLHTRFGPGFIKRLEQIRGTIPESIVPVELPVEYHERLPCLSPIVSAAGIEIAIKELLQKLCKRLYQEQKGIRKASLTCYRVDGHLQKLEIGTVRPTHQETHLFRLFELKIDTIEPGLGLEMFVLDAIHVEELNNKQETLWTPVVGIQSQNIAATFDLLAAKVGSQRIYRFVPNQVYLPEYSFKRTTELTALVGDQWSLKKKLPFLILPVPKPIKVTVPVPDYPPINFIFEGKLYEVSTADGPWRVEKPWWIQAGLLQDYYIVEDNQGARYSIFRVGHIGEVTGHQWFLYGYYA